MSDTKVLLPPGCYGLQMTDGTEYNHKPGGAVHLPDHHADQIKRSIAGHNGTVSTTRSYSIGTRNGKRCEDPECGFLAQAWARSCPRCGSSDIRIEVQQ